MLAPRARNETKKKMTKRNHYFSVLLLLIKFSLIVQKVESFSPSNVPCFVSRPTTYVVPSPSAVRWSKFFESNEKEENSSSSSREDNNVSLFLPQPLSKLVRASLAIALLLSASVQSPLQITPPAACAADGSRVVGEISGSGLVFKDTLRVESFDDPKVKGVTLYLTNFERPLTERLQKDFFSDPSASSLTCVRSGPVTVADNIGTGTSGEEVFEESRSLLFKTLRVRRIYDKEKNAIVYVTYNTRLNKNDDDNRSRFKTSICSVSLFDVAFKEEK